MIEWLLARICRVAFSSMRGSPGARAYYQQLRNRKIGHQAALRQLARPTMTDYGVIMLRTDEVPIDRPCEDCGGLVVWGLEPFAPGDDPELEAEGLTAARSQWCTNLDCPSNHVLRGLTRVGVNNYICTVCGKTLRTPVSSVFAHRRTH